jgi:hypothetical protein
MTAWVAAKAASASRHGGNDDADGPIGDTALSEDPDATNPVDGDRANLEEISGFEATLLADRRSRVTCDGRAGYQLSGDAPPRLIAAEFFARPGADSR